MADSVISSARILVVDDDETVRSTLKEYLDANGFQVITAGNGKEAIDLMAENREQIGLVVSDIRMPVLDGISLIRRIRESGHAIPIVVISGYIESATLNTLDEFGISVFKKPLDLRALGCHLAEALHRN